MASGGRIKNLFGNMAILTIGSFVSKLMVMLLVPLYTSVLTTDEYGIADGLQTTLILLVPLVTMNIGEAALRYGIEREGQRTGILRIMLKYTAIADIIVVALCGAGYFAAHLAAYVNPVAMLINAKGGITPKMYFLFFELLFISNSLYEGMILYCQGCERVKTMITGSVTCTAVIIASNLFFLLVLRIGLTGYLLSQIIAYTSAGIVMLLGMREYLGGLFRRPPGKAGKPAGEPGAEAGKTLCEEVNAGEPASKIRSVEHAEENGNDTGAEAGKTTCTQENGGELIEVSGRPAGAEEDSGDAQAQQEELEREMTKYGRSMIAYSTSSWINNAIDRYFVIAMCGAAANGLYAVAYKVPAILNVLQRIFAQAWQISANKTYDDEDASSFFSNIYEGYQSLLTVGGSFLILVTVPVAGLLFAKEFFKAWPLVPPLLISVIFGALTGFLGSICLAFKDGNSMGFAAGAGATVNICLNFVMIRYMGPMGAAMSTMISYGIMFMLSLRAAGRHVKLRIRTVRDMTAYLLLMIQMLFTSARLEGGVFVSAACFVVIFAMYMKRLIGVARERFGKK